MFDGCCALGAFFRAKHSPSCLWSDDGFRSPVGERPSSLCLPTLALGARANSEAGPKGGGQEARSQEKKARERAPRMARSQSIPGLRVCGRVTGLILNNISDRASCTVDKLARILASHSASFPPPARRAKRGPGKAARSCAQKPKQEQEQEQEHNFKLHFSFALCSCLCCCLCFCAQERAVLPGPLCGGEAWTKRPARGVGRDADSFSSGQEALSKSPATPHGLSSHGWLESAKRGALLFGYFLLSTQEKVTRLRRR